MNGPITERPAIYLLEAFGIHDPWVLWRIRNGCLVDDGRLTSKPIPDDIGDPESNRIAMLLGIVPERPNPYEPVRINRMGLDANRRRASGGQG